MNTTYSSETVRRINLDAQTVGLSLPPKTKPEAPSRVNMEDYLPTVDQLNYTIHILQKQEGKLNHALKQVWDTITKLEILRELSKEKESKNNGN